MSSRRGISVVTKAAETADTVASVLDSSDRFALADVCQDIQSLAVNLERTPSAAVLVDIDPDPPRLLANLDPVTQKFSQTRFIVLSDTVSNDLVLRAMQAGARHFLAKQSIASDLGEVLHRLIPNGEAMPQALGRTVAVLSAGGGCGASTLVVNLASELHLLSSAPVLLVDLDCCYGAIAAYLGLQGQYGIADVLDREGEIDHELVRSVALVSSDGLHGLLSPATIDPVSPKRLEYRSLRGASQVFRRAYGYTVIDAPRVPIEVAADLVAASDETLLVCQLTVKDILTARAMTSAVAARGAPVDRMTCLINRYHRRRSMIPLSDAENALKGIPVRCMRSDYRSAVKSVNLGRPLAQVAPRSALRADLKKLANDVFGRRSK